MLPYENQIRTQIQKVLKRTDCKALKPTDALIYNGLDSLFFLELIVAIEDEFSIQIPKSMMKIENIKTIEEISKLICCLKQDESTKK